MQTGPEFGHLQGKVLVVKKALYRLKSFGVAFETLDNNLSVVRYSYVLSLTFNKKHSLIAHYSCSWHVAAGVIEVAWISTDNNLVGAMTKRWTFEKKIDVDRLIEFRIVIQIDTFATCRNQRFITVVINQW